MTEAVEAEAYAIFIAQTGGGTICMQKVLEASPEYPVCQYLNTI